MQINIPTPSTAVKSLFGSTFWTGLIAVCSLVFIFILSLRRIAVPQVLVDVVIGTVVGHFAVQVPQSSTP